MRDAACASWPGQLLGWLAACHLEWPKQRNAVTVAHYGCRCHGLPSTAVACSIHSTSSSAIARMRPLMLLLEAGPRARG
jgi:hypothetical protein